MILFSSKSKLYNLLRQKISVPFAFNVVERAADLVAGSCLRENECTKPLRPLSEIAERIANMALATILMALKMIGFKLLYVNEQCQQEQSLAIGMFAEDRQRFLSVSLMCCCSVV